MRRFVANLLLLLALTGSAHANPRCGDLQQFIERLQGLEPGAPFQARSVRGNPHSGVVENVTVAPDGRRLISIIRRDGTRATLFADQLELGSLAGRFEALTEGMEVQVRSLSGNSYGGIYRGKLPDGSLMVEEAGGRLSRLNPARLDERSLRVRAPGATALSEEATVIAAAPGRPPAAGMNPMQRAQVIRSEFPPGSPSRTKTTSSMSNRPHPNGVNLPLQAVVEDGAYGRRMGLVFDDVSPGQLRQGRYTYVITQDGSVSFGLVEDSWEFGVKHLHIAAGRPVVAAGELEVTAQGSLRFNTESGTFTRQLVAQGVTEDQLAQRVQNVFSREVGAQRVQRVGNGEILQPGSRVPPTRERIAQLCATPEFRASNGHLCF
jgi:hypothetical protein